MEDRLRPRPHSLRPRPTFRRCGNSGLVCPPSPSVFGRTSVAPMSLKPAAPWSVAPSIAESPTSISPITTALPMARPKKLRHHSQKRLRRAKHSAACATNSSSYQAGLCGPVPTASAHREYLLASPTTAKRMGDYVGHLLRASALGIVLRDDGALVTAVHQGKAFMSASPLSARRTRARRSSSRWACLSHSPASYSM